MPRTDDSPRTFNHARAIGMSQAERVVLDVLEARAANYGLNANSLAQATGYSASRVRSALAGLVDLGLVKQSPFRNSRGYSFTAVSDQDREAAAARQDTVEALEGALEALLGSSMGVQVSGLVGGGVSIRMTQPVAKALLATVKHAVED